MTGSVRKRSKKKGRDGLDSWQIRICIGMKPDGQPERHEETIRGKREDADRLLRKRMDEFESGRLARPTKDTVEAYLREWLETTASKRSARTNQDYLYALNRYVFPVIGSLPLQRLNPLSLQRLYTGMEGRGLSGRTIRITHNVIRSGLKAAVRWRLLPQNPALDVELPKEKRPGQSIRALNAEQAQTLLKVTEEDRLHAMFVLALDSGCRPEEYLGLCWPEVDLEAGSIRVLKVLVRLRGQSWSLEEPKTKSSRRTIKLSPPTVAALRRHKAEQAKERLALGPAYQNQGFVFANRTGAPLDLHNLRQRDFKRAFKKAGLPAGVRPYDLRHSMATLLLAAGVNPKVVAERLGHSGVNMTLQVYCSVLPSMQEAAADQIGKLLFGGGARG